jgi:hypothetical protein
MKMKRTTRVGCFEVRMVGGAGLRFLAPGFQPGENDIPPVGSEN